MSIVIIHYRTLNLTLECIRSIHRYAPLDPFEVILVDNGSDDGIEDVLRDEFPQVRFLETGGNIGYARANNLGIYNSHGDFVLLLNSDTRFFDTTLQAMLDYLQFHPETGVLGPRQVDGEGRFIPSCGDFPTLRSELLRKIIHYRLSVNDYRLRDYIDERHANMSRVDWVSGSCLLVRRKALYDAGLLDECFFMYFEDIDFCRRVGQSGWKIEYFPDQTLTHYGGQSAKINILDVMIQNRKSQLYFSRKHYGYGGAAVVRLLLVLKYGLNVIRWSLVLAIRSCLGRKTRYPYTMSLVAKKIIAMALAYVPPKPFVPRLPRRSVRVSRA